MSNLENDRVEIVEPPLGEFTKKSSRFTLGLLTGAIIIILLIITGIIAIRFSLGSGPSTLRAVPDNFPANFPLYAKENIERITLIPGRYQNRGRALLGFFPRLFLSSDYINFYNQQAKELPTSTLPSNQSSPTALRALTDFWQSLTTPESATTDIVQVEWRNMDAEPSFVIKYYQTELRKEKYIVNYESDVLGGKIIFYNVSSAISGVMIVTGNEEDHPGTDYAVLTVSYQK